MTAESQRRPKAFVIMPFAEDFDDVYTSFIRPSLEEAGLDVLRADDIRSQQNILRDVVTGISQADLVIADLTDSNANVYYELGIAHALGKRVVLLTQDLDELPFDLRAYRVIPYDTHFARIEAASTQLQSVAEEAIRGQLPFGNPVTDFLPSETRLFPSPPMEQIAGLRPSESEQEELGLLDHLANVEEGLDTVTEIVSTVSERMESIGSATNQIAARIRSLIESPGPQFVRDSRTLVMGLAQHIGDFSRFLGDQNNKYVRTLYNLRNGMEFVLAAQQPENDDQRERLRSFLETLEIFQATAVQARRSIEDLAETVRGMPRVERTFNRSADNLVRELVRYAENIDQTISVVARAREVGGYRLS